MRATVSGSSPTTTVLFLFRAFTAHPPAEPTAGDIAWYGGPHDKALCRLRKRPRFTRTAHLIRPNGSTTGRHAYSPKRFYNRAEPSGVPNCGKLYLLGTRRFTRWSNAANFHAAFILRRAVWSGISPRSRRESTRAPPLPTLLSST